MGEELAVVMGKSLHSPCIKLKLKFNDHEITFPVDAGEWADGRDKSDRMSVSVPQWAVFPKAVFSHPDHPDWSLALRRDGKQK
jgi:hypothetical protein